MAGILWAIVAGVGFGFFQVVNRKGSQGIDIYRGTLILLAVSTAILAIISAATRDLSVLSSASVTGLLYFALAGIIHFSIGWTTFSISQQHIGAARTGAIVGSSPLFGAILAFAFLGEVPQPGGLLGILLIVIGVYLVSAR